MSELKKTLAEKEEYLLRMHPNTLTYLQKQYIKCKFNVTAANGFIKYNSAYTVCQSTYNKLIEQFYDSNGCILQNKN